MPWTEITLAQVRDGLRYSSDTTDAKWALIAPWIPKPRRLGINREANLRAIVDLLL